MMFFLPDYSLTQDCLDASHVDDQGRSVISVQHASGLCGNFAHVGHAPQPLQLQTMESFVCETSGIPLVSP